MADDTVMAPGTMPVVTREGLVSALWSLRDASDPEAAHIEADNLLLAYLDDEEIAAAFWAIPRWYA